MAVEITHECRLCRTVVPTKRSTSLFSPLGLQQKWASRIEHLLDVSAANNDGLPAYMCDKCKRRLVYLEKAAEDLSDFREQARKSRRFTVVSRGQLKRTKDTCGSVVSPDTAPQWRIVAALKS